MKVNCNPSIRAGELSLNEDRCLKIHHATLQVLERTGVEVHEKRALKLLKEAGCIVQDRRVKFPPSLVEDAIEQAPERVILADSSGKRRIFLERGRIYFGLGNDLAYFQDPFTQEVRPSLLKDVEHVAIIAEKLENIDFIASLALASDVTKELVDLYHFRALSTFSTKPILASALDSHRLKTLIEMGLLLAGGEREFRRNPCFAVYAEPTSPLLHTEEAVKKLMLSAEWGVPITYASGVLAGATGPVTIAGSFIQGNAESLSGLVIHQLTKRGAPFILGNAGGPLDMSTTVATYGGPEVSLFNQRVAEMARFYRLPSYGISGSTDACSLDIQASMEAAFSIFIAALTGSNLIHDNGYAGSGLLGHLGYLVLVHEIIGMVKHFFKEYRIDEEAIPLHVIHEVGPGGHFLLTEHTLKHHREEIWYPNFMNRSHFTKWATNDGRTMGEKASLKAQELLEEEAPEGASEAILQEMDRIIEEQERHIEEVRG